MVKYRSPAAGTVISLSTTTAATSLTVQPFVRRHGTRNEEKKSVRTWRNGLCMITRHIDVT